MECKKIYQLHEMCNEQLPPCYLYKCEAEATTEMFMTTPEAMMDTTLSSLSTDPGVNILKGLGIFGCVAVGLTLLGYGFWILYKKYTRGTTEPPQAIEYFPDLV